MMIIGAVLSLLIGVSLGLLGGGGSILTVPILMYAMKVEPHQAIAMSLFVVGVTSASGLWRHALLKNVAWKVGLLFSIGGMSGAYMGGRIGATIPATVLMVAFSSMMGLTAFMMLRKKKEVIAETRKLNTPMLLAQGLGVGLVTGMVGAGGGFLVVPALVFFAGLEMRKAIGTSLLVIALNTFAGLGGYLHEVSFDWSIAILVSFCAIIGSFLGAHWAHRFSPERLRKIFAWFIIAMALFILARETGLLF